MRRAELVALKVDDFQIREEHCVIADLIGKGKHIRTVPVPSWVKRTLDAWTASAKISTCAIFRRVNRMGKVWGDGLTPKAIWHVVKAAAQRAGIKNLAPHDLRRYAECRIMPNRWLDLDLAGVSEFARESDSAESERGYRLFKKASNSSSGR